MSNIYFDPTSYLVVSGTKARASAFNNTINAIEDGFDSVETAMNLKASLISPALVTPNLGTPSAGTLTNCIGLPLATGITGLGSNVAAFLATPSSANLIAVITDETGTGSLVFSNSPIFVTPNLGTPSALVGTNITGVAAGLTAGAATTLAVGSDADGDTYFRTAGVLTRLAKGAADALYGMNDSATTPTYKSLKVTDAGVMSNASQPSFLANIASAQTNVTGDGTIYNLTGAIWTELYAKGATPGFSNGTFTAQATGTYLFTGRLYIYAPSAAWSRMYLSLITSNRNFYCFDRNPATMGGYERMPWSILADLDVGDTAYLALFMEGSTKTITLGASTQFSGMLIG